MTVEIVAERREIGIGDGFDVCVVCVVVIEHQGRDFLNGLCWIGFQCIDQVEEVALLGNAFGVNGQELCVVVHDWLLLFASLTSIHISAPISNA